MKITVFGAASAWTVYVGRATVGRYRSKSAASRAANKLRAERQETKPS